MPRRTVGDRASGGITRHCRRWWPAAVNRACAPR